eukprot:SAG25_NODE_4597_length_785_cov_1.392128_1_plen_83_part_10
MDAHAPHIRREMSGGQWTRAGRMTMTEGKHGRAVQAEVFSRVKAAKFRSAKAQVVSLASLRSLRIDWRITQIPVHIMKAPQI